MTAEEELIYLRQENRLLREQANVHQETISVQRELINRQQEQITLLERGLSLQQEQMTQLADQVKALQERLAKDSHNSHLPPSSDRFSRQPKSLHKKSGKKSGGQEGHPGKILMFSPCPDEVMVHPVERCEQCLNRGFNVCTKVGRNEVQYEFAGEVSTVACKVKAIPTNPVAVPLIKFALLSSPSIRENWPVMRSLTRSKAKSRLGRPESSLVP